MTQYYYVGSDGIPTNAVDQANAPQYYSIIPHNGSAYHKQTRYAINPHGVDKSWDFEKLATGYQDKTGTLQDFLDHIKQGHAVCAGLLGGQRRTKANVIGSQVAMLDIDNSSLLLDTDGKPVKGKDGKSIKVYNPQLTLDEALQHPFIQQHCSLIYTSASHRPDWHKFRLVFLLPEFEADVGIIEAMILLLMEQLPHDAACKDASRVFYGNTRAEIPLFNPNVTLPLEWREQAITAAADELAKKEQQRQQQETRQRRYQQQVDRGEVDRLDTDALVLDALDFIPPRNPGTGNYQECLTVLMALCDHFGASEAERIAERWSPSIKGSWDISRKIRSFKRGGVGVGSLFHIAKQHGWRFPEREQKSYQQQKEATVSRDEWEYKFGHQFSDLNGWLGKLKNRLAKASKRVSGWGFGKKSEVEPNRQNQCVLDYKLGERLDAWGEYVKYWAQASEPYEIRQALFLLDNSATGTGKSFDCGMATPELFGARQVIYLSSEHRNPTVPTLKCWDDLEARHEGLYVNEFAKLRRVTKPDQPSHVAANCGRHGTLSALRSKNIPGVDTASEICSSCKYLEMCRGGVGTYNYLNARAETLSQSRFRAHPASLPSPSEYNYEDVVLVWDEAGESLKPHKSVEVTEKDLNLTVARLAMKFPEAWDTLRLLLNNLHEYLSGEHKQPNKFGWNDTQIRGLLPKVDGVDVGAIAEALKPDLSFLNTTSEHGVDLADLPRNLRKSFSDSDGTTAEKVYKEVALNWLPDFLDVLLGNVKGAVRVQHGRLNITTSDPRLVEIARAAKANIFLDATMTVEDLALVLGLDDPTSIINIRQAIPNNNNLEVIQVATMGRLGIGSRRKDEKGEDTFLQKRIFALTDQIKRIEAEGKTVAVIDFKKFAKADIRSWWADTRGVNDFETVDVLILIGVPCPNLADLEAEFTVLHGRAPVEGTERVLYPVQVTGEGTSGLQPYFEMNVSADPDFRDFVRSRILANYHQANGRLRAHRRPGQQLKVYIIADYPLDIPVTLRKASDITPDAGTKIERVEMAIRGAFDQLKATGQKVTQAAIAGLTGLSQGYISRFRELLQTLLEPINSKSNNSNAPPPDRDEAEWMAAQYLPLLADSPPKELLDGVLSTSDAYGAVVFKTIWDATPAAAQIKILQKLMFTLSADELRSLLESAEVMT